jgi:hypothetical protein
MGGKVKVIEEKGDIVLKRESLKEVHPAVGLRSLLFRHRFPSPGGSTFFNELLAPPGQGPPQFAVHHRPAMLIDAIWQRFAEEIAGMITCAKCAAPKRGRWCQGRHPSHPAAHRHEHPPGDPPLGRTRLGQREIVQGQGGREAPLRRRSLLSHLSRPVPRPRTCRPGRCRAVAVMRLRRRYEDRNQQREGEPGGGVPDERFSARVGRGEGGRDVHQDRHWRNAQGRQEVR